MKPYGRNEYCGLHSVDDIYPDKADGIFLGISWANASKSMTRRLQKKKMRSMIKQQIRKEIEEI